MQILKDLDAMFESDTIKPTFNHAHILLSLLIFENHPQGIGRYRLKEELLIGMGTARSLITRLKDKVDFIKVSVGIDQNNQPKNRLGHILTENGIIFLERFKKKIPLLKKGDLKLLKEIIIDAEKNYPFICIVKKGDSKIKYGMEQRDAAIKVNGSGATCLVFNGDHFVFPASSNVDNSDLKEKANINIEDYFKELILSANGFLEKGDVFIIGLGDEPKKARLASLNAALTLI
ncbi:MAG: hypothetical protein KGD73_04465 [Candidatus Lokiarchaeota archaeon]|nr:hypothetical protein [Candidatus Lokiarchaeota archaeon]